MPSLAEIVMMGGRARADSMRRLADIDYNRRQQQTAMWGNLGMNLAQIGTTAALNFYDARQKTKAAEGAKAEKAHEGQIHQFASATADERQPDGMYLINPKTYQQALQDMNKGHLLTPEVLAGIEKMNTSTQQFRQIKIEALADRAWAIHNLQYDPDEMEHFARNAAANELLTQEWLDRFLAAPVEKQKLLVQGVMRASKRYADVIKPTEPDKQLYERQPDGTIKQVGSIPATGQLLTPPASPQGQTSQSEWVRINGKDVLASYVPGVGGKEGRLFYNGQDVTGQATRIPPASGVNVSLGPSGNLQSLFTGDRPDPKTANKVDPRTGLTPNALDQMAMTFATMGTGVTSNSRNPQVMARSSAILNTASAMAAAAGVDLALLRTEYKAHASTFSKLLERVTFTKGALEAAKANMALVRQYADQVSRTDMPRLNEIVQSLKKNFGATDLPHLTALEVAVFGAAREYARATSGGAQSIAQMTDGATSAATALLNTFQTTGSMNAALDVMEKDMTTQSQPYVDQLNKLLDTGETQNVRKFLNWRLGGLLDQGSAAAPAPAGVGRGGGPQPPRPPGVAPGAMFNGRTWVAGLPGQVWDDKLKQWVTGR